MISGCIRWIISRTKWKCHGRVGW